MPTPTPELGLSQALDGDDTAAYLDTSLANSLVTIDSLFNNVSGHTHGGVHQGGPINAIPASAIPDGSITSIKIADGTIQTVDLADGSVTAPKIAAGAVTTPAIASGVTITSPTINGGTINSASEVTPTISNPTINGTISGSPTFNAGPNTTDWFRATAIGNGLFNTAANAGVGIDAGGPYVYGAYGGGHLITETAAQTLTNKTLTSPTINGGTLTSVTVTNPTLNSPTLNSATLVNPTLSGNMSGGNHSGGLWNGYQVAETADATNRRHIESNNYSFNGIPNNTPVTTVISFARPFAVLAPQVVASVQDYSPSTDNPQQIGIRCGVPNTTTFTLEVWQNTGAALSVTIAWIAFGI